MINNKITVGITQGDGNGIGYEVIIKALADQRILDSFTPVIYGSSKVFGFYRKLIHNLDPLDTYVINSAKEARLKKINILNCLPDNIFVEPGQSTPESAKSAITSLGGRPQGRRHRRARDSPYQQEGDVFRRLRIHGPYGISQERVRRL